MKEDRLHVFLLGPPAVGKGSVAHVLSDSTGYPVFDNAKTVDIARLLHSYGTERFRRFRDELRMSFYREIGSSTVMGLISTFCYRHPKNWEYLYQVERIIRESNWRTIYFLLFADIAALKKRVVSPERRAKRTLYTGEEIEEWLSSSPRHREIDGNKCTTIDTTLLTVHQVVSIITKEMEDMDGI